MKYVALKYNDLEKVNASNITDHIEFANDLGSFGIPLRNIVISEINRHGYSMLDNGFPNGNLMRVKHNYQYSYYAIFLYDRFYHIGRPDFHREIFKKTKMGIDICLRDHRINQIIGICE